eukprot:scaffold188449_cov19-Tisochrysis_lutea.AAC.1
MFLTSSLRGRLPETQSLQGPQGQWPHSPHAHTERPTRPPDPESANEAAQQGAAVGVGGAALGGLDRASNTHTRNG